jgi:hypothetical protein
VSAELLDLMISTTISRCETGVDKKYRSNPGGSMPLKLAGFGVWGLIRYRISQLAVLGSMLIEAETVADQLARLGMPSS